MKKVIGLMKDELGGKIMAKFVGLRAKTYSYFIDGGSQEKKTNSSKKLVMKRNLKFENYKSCKNNSIINHLEKSKIDIDSVKENHKEFRKNNKSILKIQ